MSRSTSGDMVGQRRRRRERDAAASRCQYNGCRDPSEGRGWHPPEVFPWHPPLRHHLYCPEHDTREGRGLKKMDRDVIDSFLT